MPNRSQWRAFSEVVDMAHERSLYRGHLGRKFVSLERHLAQLGMTLGEYRAKWHLPKDCPMIAPNEAATRSALATRSASAASRFRPPRSY